MQLESITRDRYQIVQVIEELYNEHTYLVEDKSASNEKCILKKFIPVSSSAAAAEATFHGALEQLKNLHHRQIERIKDFWSDNDQLFMVFSYHQGKSYQDRLQSNSPLSEADAIALLNSALPALSYLHNQQTFHGNIAPDNLIENNNGSVTLSNFQTIENIKAQIGIQPLEQRLGNKLRTLPIGHIAPGKDEDLYALAVTVIMLLTGKDVATLFNYQNRCWDWENYKLVSDRLTDVLDKMLASQPHERYPNAEAVLQALNSTSTPFVPPAPQPYSPPPAPQTYQQQPTYQQPPVAPVQPSYQPPAPSNTTQLQSNSIKTTGLKDWHKAILIGGGVGLIILLCIIFLKPIFFSEAEDVAPVAETVKPEETKPEPPPEPALSKQDAVNIVNKYLQAKSEILSPPFNKQLASTVLTGKALHDVVKPGGTIDWLIQNNGYYRYGTRKAEPLYHFWGDKNHGEIDVKIYEEYYYYQNNKLARSKKYSGDFHFKFRKENGAWKIYDKSSKK